MNNELTESAKEQRLHETLSQIDRQLLSKQISEIQATKARLTALIEFYPEGKEKEELQIKLARTIAAENNGH